MKKITLMLMGLTVVLGMAGPALGHFGMLIPSDSMVMQDDNRTLNLKLSFSHPMEQVGMELEKPETFEVFRGNLQQDLTSELQPARVMGHTAWSLDYRIKRPGVYVFVMQPKPYWEPVEDVFIIHYTKTVVAAFGDDQGWDRELGLKTEIVPLAKPFGLYAGNVFQGIVKLNGKIVPFAEVEVEYDNAKGTVRAPTDYMVTQTIKADANGVFTYAAPKPGWWGFAALNQADFKLKTEAGEEKGVELGAVIWVHFEEWIEK
jgi:cobalt/nickel transport protein